MRRRWIIALLLVVATLALYWPVRCFDLIYFDDPLFMTDSPEVKAGLTWASLKWALTSVVLANWQPLTNLSFLLVSQFFGIAPGAHHLANAIIHALNAGLLFLLLERLTKSTWRSATAAAIFAWHPLRVESVAWISERKDVLCAFFFLLALYLYTRFTQESGAAGTASAGRIGCARRFGRVDLNLDAPNDVRGARGATRPIWPIEAFRFVASKRVFFYMSSLLAFAAALLSKPMAVTLPCVLLLFDVWPLGRALNEGFEISNLKRLVFEKIPFFLLMLLFCLATYRIQHDYAAMASWENLGLAPRVANAISGYLAYPAKLLWPANLAVIYPYPKSIDVLESILKAGLLLAISAGCVLQLGRRPWLLVGWFWYLATALPIIGFVQVGKQAMADRYTYLPLIGLAVALVWTAAGFFSSSRNGKTWLTVMAIGILSTLAAMSERQLQFWQNTIVLFEHTIEVLPNNAPAEFTLGVGFEHTGDTNRAIVCYRIAKMIEPGDFDNRRNLAGLLTKQGYLGVAEQEFEQLLINQPADCRNHLGLAGALAGQGRTDEAVFQLNETLRLDSTCVEALNNLAWTLATSPRAEIRDGPRAVKLAEHACELTHFDQTIFIGTLAAAYAEAGKFDDAIATAQRACAVAGKNGETDLLQRNRQLLGLYQNHKTVREE